MWRCIVGKQTRSRTMVRVRQRDWTEKLFVHGADVYLPFLEELKDRGEREAKAVAGLLRQSGVPPGSRILDLCCGIGRHSVPLARLGYRVVGLDLSPRFLSVARRYAKARHVSDRASFVRGDFRRLERSLSALGTFDGVLNGFTSIGYYGKAVDRRALSAAARHTRPKGVLVLWLANKDWILKYFQSQGWSAAGDTVVLEERRYDRARSFMRNRWEFFRRRAGVLRSMGVFRVDHRLYGPTELRTLLASAGWKVRSLAANFRGDPIDVRHRARGAIVAVAERH